MWKTQQHQLIVMILHVLYTLQMEAHFSVMQTSTYGKTLQNVGQWYAINYALQEQAL